MQSFCTSDHYLLPGTIFENSVLGISVLHDIDNLSDHDAVNLLLSMDFECTGKVDRVFSRGVSWAKANEAQLCNYQKILSEYLCNVKLPGDTLLCEDLRCQKDSHIAVINVYAGKIIAACMRAEEETIPMFSRRIPGWTEHVQ